MFVVQIPEPTPVGRPPRILPHPQSTQLIGKILHVVRTGSPSESNPEEEPPFEHAYAVDENTWRKKSRLLLGPQGLAVAVCAFERRSGRDCSLRDSGKVCVNLAQIWGKICLHGSPQIAQIEVAYFVRRKRGCGRVITGPGMCLVLRGSVLKFLIAMVAIRGDIFLVDYLSVPEV